QPDLQGDPDGVALVRVAEELPVVGERSGAVQGLEGQAQPVQERVDEQQDDQDQAGQQEQQGAVDAPLGEAVPQRRAPRRGRRHDRSAGKTSTRSLGTHTATVSPRATRSGVRSRSAWPEGSRACTASSRPWYSTTSIVTSRRLSSPAGGSPTRKS